MRTVPFNYINLWLVPGFSSKNLGYFQIKFFQLKWKKNWNQLYIFTSALFQSLFDLEIAIEIRQVHKRFIKLSITLLFWHDVLYSFWT